MDQKVKRILKSKTEMKTSTGSSFYKVEFQDGSNFSFFHATDVENLSSIEVGMKVQFTAYKKGDWNNGKDISVYVDEVETDFIQEPKSNITLKELLRDLTSAVYELISELKKQ